jgi:hypothetical protein
MSVQHGPLINTNELVFCLDAANPRSYPGSGTTWFDLSGNNNHVTMQNSPTWNTNGWFSTGATGYFVRASGNNIPVGNDPYTLQAWIRMPVTWTGAGSILTIGLTGTNNQFTGIRTQTSVGEFLHSWWFNDIGNGSSNAAGIAVGRWFMITASFDLVTRRTIADTTEIARDTPGGHNVSSSRIQVAANPQPSDYLNGDISAAYIYRRALSLNEIQQNFDALRGRYGV